MINDDITNLSQNYTFFDNMIRANASKLINEGNKTCEDF